MEFRRTRFTTTIAVASLASSLLLAACGSAATPPAGVGSSPAGSTAATSTAGAVRLPATVASTPTAAPPVTSAPLATATSAATGAGVTPTAATTPSSVPSTNATPASGSTPRTAGATPSASAAATATAIRYDVVPAGSQAQFEAVEQLVGRDLPNDAIGTTSGVSGDIVLGADGKVMPDQSKVVADLATLKSDQSRRDNFIKRNTLDTAQYPTATFVPTAIEGLPSPLPTSGSQTFQILGNLTIHGVTKPVTWDVTAQASGDNVTGQATTSFTFEDFGMTPPKAGPVLSVQDNVKLAVTLHLVRSG